MMRSVALSLAVVFAGCAASAPSDARSDGGSSSAGAAALDVVPVAQQRLEKTVRLPGELSSFETVALFPRVSAFVEEVLVDRGSKVKRGDLLVRLSAPELSAQRAEAEAKASIDRQTAERLKNAAGTPGAVSKQEIDVAESAARAGDDKVRSLRTLEGYLMVRASFDGVITRREVHPGALVGPSSGTAMLWLQHVSALRLTVDVPEADAGAIAEGDKAAFTVPAWPGQTFGGVIRRIAHAVDVRTRSMPVELDVDNRDGRLAPGMLAEVRWPLRRATPSLVVPASAIAQTTERTFVDRVRDGVVEQVPVRRGLAIGDKAEVFGALAPGDLVLRRGSEEMKSGARVATKVWSPDGGTGH
jgi:RND family efflux transporter MFP subunit